MQEIAHSAAADSIAEEEAAHQQSTADVLVDLVMKQIVQQSAETAVDDADSAARLGDIVASQEQAIAEQREQLETIHTQLEHEKTAHGEIRQEFGLRVGTAGQKVLAQEQIIAEQREQLTAMRGQIEKTSKLYEKTLQDLSASEEKARQEYHEAVQGERSAERELVALHAQLEHERKLHEETLEGLQTSPSGSSAVEKLERKNTQLNMELLVAQDSLEQKTQEIETLAAEAYETVLHLQDRNAQAEANLAGAVKLLENSREALKEASIASASHAADILLKIDAETHARWQAVADTNAATRRGDELEEQMQAAQSEKQQQSNTVATSFLQRQLADSSRALFDATAALAVERQKREAAEETTAAHLESLRHSQSDEEDVLDEESSDGESTTGVHPISPLRICSSPPARSRRLSSSSAASSAFSSGDEAFTDCSPIVDMPEFGVASFQGW